VLLHFSLESHIALFRANLTGKKFYFYCDRMIVEKFCGIILVAFICSVIAAPTDEITTENAMKMTTVDNTENEIDGKLSDDEKTTMLSDIDRKIESIEADDEKRFEEEMVLTTEEFPVKIESNESTTSASQVILSSSIDTSQTIEPSSNADPNDNARKLAIINFRKSLRAHIIRILLLSLQELKKRQELQAQESQIAEVTMKSPNAGDEVQESESKHSKHVRDYTLKPNTHFLNSFVF
jgi:hypothetical protein